MTTHEIESFDGEKITCIEVTLNETKGTMHGFDIATKAPTTLAAMEQRIAFMKRKI